MANDIVPVHQIIEKAMNISIEESDVEEEVKKIIDKAKELGTEEKVKLLLQAITHIDLTSLKGGETTEEIKELCKKAADAIQINFDWEKPIRTAAVCVYPASAVDAVDALNELEARDKVKVASVAADFPAAKLPLDDRIAEIKKVVDFGVDEIDIVINRKLALDKEWNELYNELKLMREACETKVLKIILATGDLSTLRDVYIASIIAMLAGADFIKTSTGKEEVNATLPVGIVMCKAIKDFYDTTGDKIGLKPAGGIKTADDVLQWMTLMTEQLGNEWLTKDLFRIGASSVLDNIVKTVHTLKP